MNFFQIWHIFCWHFQEKQPQIYFPWDVPFYFKHQRDNAKKLIYKQMLYKVFPGTKAENMWVKVPESGLGHNFWWFVSLFRAIGVITVIIFPYRLWKPTKKDFFEKINMVCFKATLWCVTSKPSQHILITIIWQEGKRLCQTKRCLTCRKVTSCDILG